MKNKYVKPSMVIVKVDERDLIATSTGDNGFGPDDEELGARERRNAIWDED